MLRARKSGVLTPCIFFVEHEAATIFMEKIVGQSVRDILLSGNLTSDRKNLQQAHHKHMHRLAATCLHYTTQKLLAQKLPS